MYPFVECGHEGIISTCHLGVAFGVQMLKSLVIQMMEYLVMIFLVAAEFFVVMLLLRLVLIEFYDLVEVVHRKLVGLIHHKWKMVDCVYLRKCYRSALVAALFFSYKFAFAI